MNTPSIALYAGGLLRPQDIMKAMNVRNVGVSTIILDMFHIGNPAVKAGTQLGDIIFNGDDPLVIRDGKYGAASDWPGHIAELKGSGSKVTQLYACFGDAFRGSTISKPSRRSTRTTTIPFPGPSWKRIVSLSSHLPRDRRHRHRLRGTYDLPSFVAFCIMLIRLGFNITFCPYDTNRCSGRRSWFKSNKPIRTS